MRAWTIVFGAVAVVTGCEGCELFDGGGPPDGVGQGDIGSACSENADCRLPLQCATDGPSPGTCQGAMDTAPGDACQLSAECEEGYFCGAERVCVEAGMGAIDDVCESTDDCRSGLVCSIRGFFASCQEAGEGDVAAPCQADLDCAPGLRCLSLSSAGAQCLSPPATDPGTPSLPTIPMWDGVECVEDTGAARAYFEVPRFEGSDNDFYRLPFPNDIRRRGNRIDLRNHPSPETMVDGEIISEYLRTIEEDVDGFSMNPVGLFRFSEPYNWDSVSNDTVRIIDLDPTSDRYGEDLGRTWLTTFGPISKYICENWLGVRTFHGSPLEPDHTYAVILGSSITPDDGGSFSRDDEFEVMLGDMEPGDSVLAAAWEAYAPLREYLETEGAIAADDILNAAVFTTQSELDMTPYREAVRAQDAPALSDLTECDAAATSPCDDGTIQRSCEQDGATNFTEIHGRIALPIFQDGTAPYLLPEDGGGIPVDGTPSVARTEEVCFALTIPDGEMPAGGWPLVIGGHGTGGSFRTLARNGMAAAAADGNVAGMPVTAATLAIDNPQHGDRKAGSELGSDVLFFNFLNPRAARDNVLQGAIDYLTLVHFATSGSISASESPTGAEVRFDPAAIAMFLHSQGGTHGSLMLPYESDVIAAVLSGNGGDLTQSLLTKTQPVDIAAVLPFALLDADSSGNLAGGGFHPMLALFQTLFDRVDSVNLGRRLFRDPVAGVNLKHVFMTYGVGDTYSTEETMKAYAQAAGIPSVGMPLVDIPVPVAASPLMGNVDDDVMMTTYTIGLKSYRPDGEDDGHFVSTRTQAGRNDTRRFIREALAGRVPTIEQ